MNKTENRLLPIIPEMRGLSVKRARGPKLFSFVSESYLPVPAVKKPIDLVPCKPCLNLNEGQTIKIDNREVAIPAGASMRLTGSAIKSLAKVYRGLALFAAGRTGWRRVKDGEVVKVNEGEKFESREIPTFRSVPRFSRD